MYNQSFLRQSTVEEGSAQKVKDARNFLIDVEIKLHYIRNRQLLLKTDIYLRQEVLRSVVSVCWFVRLLVNSFVNIQLSAVLSGGRRSTITQHGSGAAGARERCSLTVHTNISGEACTLFTLWAAHTTGTRRRNMFAKLRYRPMSGGVIFYSLHRVHGSRATASTVTDRQLFT